MANMSLSRETFHPLTIASFVLDYRLEGEPLQVVAKRVSYSEDNQTHFNPSIQEISLVFTSAVGSGCEIWLPTIKRLYQLQSQSRGSVYIRHVWIMDWPNHGDSGVLNEHVLKDTFDVQLLPMQYGKAIRGLIKSGLVDLERSKLVGVSLSAGAGAHLSVDLETVPYSALILIEPPLLHKPDLSANKSWVTRSVVFKNAQPDVWPTIEDAMLWHKARAPWKSWHPEVLQVFSETHFRNLPTAYHTENEGVTPKTYKGHVGAALDAAGGVVECIDRLCAFCASIPVHLIYGVNQTFWTKALTECIEANTRSYESCLASVTRIPEASHFVPQENPHGLAVAILRIVRGSSSTAKL